MLLNKSRDYWKRVGPSKTSRLIVNKIQLNMYMACEMCRNDVKLNKRNIKWYVTKSSYIPSKMSYLS